MNYTENFNLNLPETTDQFRVDHQNENMRNIDDKLYQLDQNATQTDIKIEELKKSGSDGKALVADAITDLGITTATNASFETIAANVTSAGTKRYNDGVNDTKVGNAAEGDVVAGKTFTSANGVGMTGTIPDRSNTIQTATTDTSDQSKSCFCINGTNVWVVPAKGLWNNWNWAASRITLPASSLGISADKIVEGKVICGVTGIGEGNSEKHGAKISVSLDDNFTLNDNCYLYKDGVLVQQKVATTRSLLFTGILEVGTYTIKYGLSEQSVTISAEDILNCTVYSKLLSQYFVIVRNGVLQNGITFQYGGDNSSLWSVTQENGYIRIKLATASPGTYNTVYWGSKFNFSLYKKAVLRCNHYDNFSYNASLNDNFHIASSLSASNSSCITYKTISWSGTDCTYELDASNINGEYYLGIYFENQSKYHPASSCSSQAPNIVDVIDLYLIP